MRRADWMSIPARLLAGLLPLVLAASGFAQQSAPPARPAAGAHIVRIEYGSSSGMCMGYCYRQTTVQAGIARTVSKTNYSLNGNRDPGYPDIKKKWKITAEEWQRAQAAIDTEYLFSLPDRIGCPGCVDEPVDWISVEYSDGTKKSVYCNAGDAATDIAEKVAAALARPASGGGYYKHGYVAATCGSLAMATQIVLTATTASCRTPQLGRRLIFIIDGALPSLPATLEVGGASLTVSRCPVEPASSCEHPFSGKVILEERPKDGGISGRYELEFWGFQRESGRFEVRLCTPAKPVTCE